MNSHSVSIQDKLLHQIISQTGIVKKEHKEHLKKILNQKVDQQILIMQHHKLRQNRFAESQRKMLEKHDSSIQKTKEYLSLRQDQAYSNKVNTLIQKSRKAQLDLQRWERIVQKNKRQKELRLNQSTKLISQWNEKLSESSSRKSMRINNIRQHLHQRSEEKQKQIQQSKLDKRQTRLNKMLNPEQKNQDESRYKKYKNPSRMNNNSRVSTQNMIVQRKKKEEDIMEQSLIQNTQKQEKINEARYIKHFLLQKRKKIKNEKEQYQKFRRQSYLKQMNEITKQRNQVLDKKFNKQSNLKTKRNSLPLVSVSKFSGAILINSPKEQYTKNIHKRQMYKDIEPNYTKLVREKMHSIVDLIRNH